MLLLLDGVATFSDLESTVTISNGVLGANCENPTDFGAVAFSDTFNVHPYPKTGNVRDASAAFMFEGTIQDVDSVLEAFAGTLGVSMDVSSLPVVKAARGKKAEKKQTYTISQEDLDFWPDFDALNELNEDDSSFEEDLIVIA